MVAERHEKVIWSHATIDIDRARLLAASSPHSGDWLAAPPNTSVGLRLSDEEIRNAVAHRLGCRACVCGKAVDVRVGACRVQLVGDSVEATQKQLLRNT